MTIKSATPSGSRRERAPAGDRPWFKADIDAWAVVRDLLPRPWPAVLCMEDLKHLAARERFLRVPWDGQTALQARWGVSASTVKRYLAAARAKDGPDLDQTWTNGEPSEPHQQPIADDARTSHGPTVDQPWTSGEPVARESAPVQQLLLAPKNQEEDKNQESLPHEAGAPVPSAKPRKPRKGRTDAGPTDDEAAGILADMHAVLSRHYPAAKPPTVSAHRDRLRLALGALAEMSAETGRPARDLLLIGWRYMVDGSRGYWQKRLPTASEWYPIACRGEAAKTNAERGMAMEDARRAREQAPPPAAWVPPAAAPAPAPVVGWEHLTAAEQEAWRLRARQSPVVQMAGAWASPIDLRQIIDTAAQAAYRDSVV